MSPFLTDRGTHPIASLSSLFWNFSDPMSSGLLQVVEAGKGTMGGGVLLASQTSIAYFRRDANDVALSGSVALNPTTPHALQYFITVSNVADSEP